MAKLSEAEDMELRRAVAAGIATSGAKEDVPFSIRVAKGRGIFDKLRRVAKPRVLALTAKNTTKGDQDRSFIRILKYSSGGVLEPAKLYKLKHLNKVEVLSTDTTGCTFILDFDNLRSHAVTPPQWTMRNIHDRNRLLLSILNMCKESLNRLPKVVGIDIVQMALWAKENTPVVVEEERELQGPNTEISAKRDQKVNVEEDLVSQAEEDDMESLLSTRWEITLES